MNRLLFSLLLLCTGSIIKSQTIIDFEEFDILVDTFLNGSEANGMFESQGIIFPNNFDPEFQSWVGWSISSVRDSITPGFTNQYAAIPASGFDESQNYAVSFNFIENGINISDSNEGIKGLYVTNNTYTYLSMRDGDAFAKKFGGETGDEPDFFLLSIVGYQNGEQNTDTIDFYLADYRFEDNSQDYLIADWSYIDLSSFGNIDSLGFNLSSSDNGQFGMNTPAYFCVDQIIFNDNMTTSTDNVFVSEIVETYPNPVIERLFISVDNMEDITVNIYNMLGKRIIEKQNNIEKGINVSSLTSGTYVIHLLGKGIRSRGLFIKN